MHLKTQNLASKRGHATLFENLSFSLEAGQLLLIEGANGAGKTTLLKILSGLRRAEKGAIFWNDEDIAEQPNPYQQAIAWLGHQNPVKDDLTAIENLTLLAHIREKNETGLVNALKTLGLGKVKHQLVKTFSAGMKRRLALASLLVNKCPLWILDEPQATLDKAGIQLFEALAQQHLDNGGLIILTSHHALNIDARYIIPLRLGK